MIAWDTLHFSRTWPLWMLAAVFVLLFYRWQHRGRTLVPDIAPVLRTRTAQGWFDRAPLASGLLLLVLLALALTAPTVVREQVVEQQARDFVVLVDTSRSMRRDTAVRRDAFDPKFERRAGAFSEAVTDFDAMPWLARYELARESLLRFLEQRGPGDRVALAYFNDDPYPVSALTSNFDFLARQLAAMDDYVNWGTNIAAALESSLRLLERYPEGKQRALILLTDAETRYTEDLEQQLAKLAESNLAFYLLWITADAGKLAGDADAAAFLQRARKTGHVVTIDEPDSHNLIDAFRDIGRMESYRYAETRREVVELAPPILAAARAGLLAWLALVATIWHASSPAPLRSIGP